MRQSNRHLMLVVGHVSLVLALTACGPAKVAVKQPPAEVHGELITPVTAPTKPMAIANAETIAKPAEAIPTTVIPARSKVEEPPPAKPVTKVSAAPEYEPVGFDTLASYNFEVDDAPVTNLTAGVDKANDQIPGTVKSFDRRKVSIRGFMLPLKVSNGTVTEFLIMKDQSMCCYGSVPKITEWVSVKTPPEGVKSIMDQPVSIEGTLHVGALRENGYLIGIYQMDGDKLVAPEN